MLVVAALIVAVIYYRFPKSSILRPLQYTGATRCAGCHSTEAIGNQFGVWASSAHTRSYSTLLSERASTYASENHRPAPQTDPFCLHCHTTEYAIAPAHKSSTFRTGEGITCEECHGPGSDYSTHFAMSDKKVFVKLGGKLGSERDCMRCHAMTMNAEHCPFQTQPFDLIKSMAAIAHPVPKKTFGITQ